MLSFKKIDLLKGEIMPKVMVISYNEIGGVPLGRHEEGNAVAYSAKWGWEAFAEIALLDVVSGIPFFDNGVAQDQRSKAESAFSSLEEMVTHDLPTVETVYVYVGESAKRAAMQFVRKIQSLGKTVHMVACDCGQQSKIEFARQLGIDITWTWCGGEETCGKIFRSNVASTNSTN